jgi:hypothetical protein
MDDQKTDRESGGNVDPFAPRITSTPRERVLGVALCLVYIGGWVFIFYAMSNRLEDRGPARVFWVAYATWFVMMLVLPLAAVCLLTGIDRGPAWMRGRFSLRGLLIVMTLVAIVLGVIASLAR